MVEIFHRQFEDSLLCHSQLNWVNALLLVLLGFYCTVKEDQAFLAELVYRDLLLRKSTKVNLWLLADT